MEVNLKVLTIKEMPLTEQPYTRLENHGAGVLSNAELLSIIIKTGTKSHKAIDIAHELLTNYDHGLLTLHALTLEELQTIKGIGRVKAIQLKALAELSIRMSRCQNHKYVKASSPKTVADYYMEEMRHLRQEQLKIVLLDTKNNIIKDHILSIGTVNASLVDPREILIYCLKQQCVQFIILHNHPSGDPTPSQEDLLITQRIEAASGVIGITLVDHIIIGDQRYISLKQEAYIGTRSH